MTDGTPVFLELDDTNLEEAARIHAISWKESHRGFCSQALIESHTPERQRAYLKLEQARGKRVFLLVDNSPKGIVSVHHSLIENLYILPGEHRKGYGTLLLRHAMQFCPETPTLWILSNNLPAYSLYSKLGFRFTGQKNELKSGLSELEMAFSGTV